MKKLKFIAALALASSAFSAYAADYYVVIPFKAKTTVDKPPTVTVTLGAVSLPSAHQGSAYAYDLKPLLQVKGDTAFDVTKVTWSLSAGTLPAGIALNADGTLSGTPTVPGQQTLTLRASYKGANGDQSYQLVTVALTVGLNAVTIPSALEGAFYTYDLKPLLQVSGDTAFDATKVTWSLSNGALPAGIVLNTDGTLTGTPTVPGQQSVTLRASYKGSNGEQTYQLVTVALSVTLNTTTPPPAMATKSYTLDLRPLLSTNDPKYSATNTKWALSAGTLPSGLTLSTTGVIAGTPTTAANSTFTVKADYLAHSSSQSYTIKVDPAAGLLMPMDGANGSTSFLDAGPAAIPFVAQGNARISTAKSMSGGASAYFDKTANTRIYATSTSAAGLNLGTSDFTVEAWVNLDIVESYYGHIFGKGNGVTAGSWTVVVYNSKLCWNVAPCSKTTPVAGTWYHVAVTRTGGTLRLFINGVLEGSQADSLSYISSGSTGNFTMGDRIGGDVNQQYPVKAYVDSLRVVVGSALYTSNFTPAASLPSY